MMLEQTAIADPPLITAAWRMYLSAFGEVNALAAQRHLMTSKEFHEVMVDPRIEKYVVTDGARVLAMAVMTDRLDAWPLISPDFFAARYPRRRVFYIGFVATADGASADLAPRLISRMYEQVIAADALAVMDFCTYNVRRGIARGTDALLHRLNDRAQGGRIDAQEFWAWDFREKDGAQ